ncbi:GNAT family N-acetyltransferase [Pararhodobacter sp. CCB-MM2]|uniref:GNAT family N-acetyltransferase n=1 Tax=Pararhodobacter sp. CCB-MM2 TaxID=1786003 RepID=UPI0009F42E84|nr:GNAT family N-acetyltransferase [Pararhodobacter sp. CCB-MM2]
MTVTVRPTRAEDAPALTAILNDIIAAGGTTAYETPFTPDALFDKHLGGKTVLCCHTVLEGDEPVGFQVLNANPALPEGWGDIASFTRREPPVRGAGTALFAATRAKARELGLPVLNATIRADNVPGLAYYAKMGFEDYEILRDVPMSDGTKVDRIRRKLIP